MRLLNTRTFTLETFFGDDPPPYAILSHTWGRQEVSLEAMRQDPSVMELEGWTKVRGSCHVAASLHFDYIWIDTCCIDTASSAELSEAINSMFRWYEKSQLCIAFLADVDLKRIESPHEQRTFARSRWFTRGWTLQELIAPPEVSFYSKDWSRLGTRHSLERHIQEITNIPTDILKTHTGGLDERNRRLDDLSVAQKMNWAAKRQTTRPEDTAYSLLGLFDINMPLLYGEGMKKAFRRLQEEIIKSTDDESIYSWRCLEEEVRDRHFWGLLAESPNAFGNYGAEMPPTRPKYLTRTSINTTTISNQGVHIALSMTPFPKDKTNTLFLAFLDCEMEGSEGKAARHIMSDPVIILQKMTAEYVRVRPDIPAVSRLRRIAGPPELFPLMGYSSDTYLTDTLGGDATQIFVPHDYKTTRYPSGIIFYYQITDCSHTVEALPHAPSWKVSPTWSLSDQLQYCEINFDITPIPSKKDLRSPTVLNMFPLKIRKTKDNGGSTTWKTCLVVGLKPMPASCLGTPPALYFGPWCALDAGAGETGIFFEGDIGKGGRRDTTNLDAPVRASLCLQRVNSRLFYRVSLDYVKREKGSGGPIGLARSPGTL